MNVSTERVVRPYPETLLPITQVDGMDCGASRLANIMHVLGGPIELTNLDGINRNLNRVSGEPTSPLEEVKFLLDQGLEVEDIGPFQNDRFQSEGISYYREFMTRYVGQEASDSWSDEEITAKKEVFANLESPLMTYPNYHDSYRPWVTSDIISMLERGYLVAAQVKPAQQRLAHAILITQVTISEENPPAFPPEFELFHPGRDPNYVVQNWFLPRLEQQLHYGTALTGVRKPDTN